VLLYVLTTRFQLNYLRKAGRIRFGEMAQKLGTEGVMLKRNEKQNKHYPGDRGNKISIFTDQTGGASQKYRSSGRSFAKQMEGSLRIKREELYKSIEGASLIKREKLCILSGRIFADQEGGSLQIKREKPCILSGRILADQTGVALQIKRKELYRSSGRSFKE